MTEKTDKVTIEQAPLVETKAKRVDKTLRLYYIVNKAGAVHAVDYTHACERLKQVGFRNATKAEVAAYRAAKPHRGLAPIAAPWTAEPEPGEEPEAED